MIGYVGWDIGAANVKAAFLGLEQGQPDLMRTAVQPLEIWREKERLAEAMRGIFTEISAGALPRAAAVTMTAELSDIFATKREGVLFVLDCVETCSHGIACYALSLSGEFVPLDEARTRPLDFAASNWLASAQWIGSRFPNCLIVDVGSTSTDILPVLDGQVKVIGRTDLERLSSGELIYTGVLRTHLAAIVHSVPIAGRFCRVSSEYFAVSGDVNLILGYLRTKDYTCTTPDGRPPSLDSSRRRLARLVCADTEMLSETEIEELARYIHARQVIQIQEGLSQVIGRLPELRRHPVVALGSGAFLARAAGAGLGLEIRHPAGNWGAEELSVAPCLAAAYLLAGHMEAEAL